MNVLVFGKTFRDNYISAFLKFCNSKNLTIYVPSTYYCDALEEAIQDVKANLMFYDYAKIDYKIDSAIYFTDYINVTEVVTLTDYHEARIPIIYINSK